MGKKWPTPMWRVMQRPTAQTVGYSKSLLWTQDEAKARAFYKKTKPRRGMSVSLYKGIYSVASKQGKN